MRNQGLWAPGGVWSQGLRTDLLAPERSQKASERTSWRRCLAVSVSRRADVSFITPEQVAGLQDPGRPFAVAFDEAQHLLLNESWRPACTVKDLASTFKKLGCKRLLVVAPPQGVGGGGAREASHGFRTQ